MLRTLLTEVLANEWGTIGPKSLEAAKMLSEKLGAKHALMVHSASVALEAILRSSEISHEDEVIVASYSDPIDSMTAAVIGAVPVFADSDFEEKITKKTKAIIVDGDSVKDFYALKAIADRHNVKLVMNLGTYADYRAEYKDAFACAVAFPCGGAVVMEDESAFNLACAYHNCGRPLTPECTLDVDDILGGDMRISEWQAAVIMNILDTNVQYKARAKKDMKNCEAFGGM